MSKTVKVLVLQNQVESLLLKDILTEREIPHMIRTYHDSAYDGLWQSQAGWGHVEAPEEYASQIKDIYDSMKPGLSEE